MIKVFIAEVVTSQKDKKLIDQRMEELRQLVSTYGGLTIVQSVQQRAKPNYTTYVGSGKLEEIIEQMKEADAELLIFGNILKPAQVYNVNEILRKESEDLDYKMQARDRVDLILKIFDRHAKSTEARLQIELASIKHMGPRIFGMGMELSRQGGGIGTSGIGETNTEIMRRHLSTRRRQIQTQLAKYEQVRKTHRESRQKKHLPTVGLVGYTNAGKSSVMNFLTNKGVLVQDKLFATLGTDVGKVYIAANPLSSSLPHDTSPQTPLLGGEGLPVAPYVYEKGVEVLINDTIGFIRDLPPSLIQAFRSTLEDSIEADVLLHVIDASDELWYDKVTVVDEILDSIGAEQERVYVLNKVDRIDSVLPHEPSPLTSSSNFTIPHPNPLLGGEGTSTTQIVFPVDLSGKSNYESWIESYCEEREYDEPTILRVSAHTGEGMEELKQMIKRKVEKM